MHEGFDGSVTVFTAGEHYSVCNTIVATFKRIDMFLDKRVNYIFLISYNITIYIYLCKFELSENIFKCITPKKFYQFRSQSKRYDGYYVINRTTTSSLKLPGSLYMYM